MWYDYSVNTHYIGFSGLYSTHLWCDPITDRFVLLLSFDVSREYVVCALLLLWELGIPYICLSLHLSVFIISVHRGQMAELTTCYMWYEYSNALALAYVTKIANVCNEIHTFSS